jgi:hypothetical protein
MPAKGTRKVPKKEKAQIIAEKRVKTAQQVAIMHGIAPNTVYSIEARATPELMAMAEDYHKEVVQQSKLNVLAGLKNMYPKLSDPETPLKDLTPATKLNHDIVQIQLGLPTNINGDATDPNSPEFKCRRFIDTALDCEINGKKPTLDDAYELLLNSNMGVENEIKAGFVERMRRKQIS